MLEDIPRAACADVGSGTWAYDGTRKHAVVNAGGNTYSYDANGNQVARNGDSVAWTSDNYADTIENGTATHEFFYDANRDRWKQTYNDGTATETTVFVDDLLEKHTKGTVTEYRHYIRAGGKPIALYTRDTTGAISIHYLLRDHLGSLAEITTGDGNFHVSENFAAFGARRDATDWSGPPAAGDEAMIADTTGRGFTFHSNLEGSGLIHMNGRVADGLTGRFLSADPIVPDPGSTQSFNRYSYVNNNPLTYRDPSGFTPCLGPEAIICIDVFRTVFSFFGHDKKKSPPKGCHLSSGVPCYGKASSSKASNVVNDILKLPLDRLLDAYLCTRVMRSPLSCLGGGVFGGAGFGGGSGLPGVNWDGITLSMDPPGSQSDGMFEGLLNTILTPWGGVEGFKIAFKCIWQCGLPGNGSLDANLAQFGPIAVPVSGAARGAAAGSRALVPAVDAVYATATERIVAGYNVWGNAARVGSTYNVNVLGLYATESSQGLGALVGALRAEAAAAGASRFSIQGLAIINQGVAGISARAAARYGLQVERINADTIILTGGL